VGFQTWKQGIRGQARAQALSLQPFSRSLFLSEWFWHNGTHAKKLVEAEIAAKQLEIRY
jgi:hypothetical protein